MLEIRYEEVAKLFTYDRETGVLYWRERTRGTIRHKYVAGSSKGNRGYRRVRIGKKKLQGTPNYNDVMLWAYPGERRDRPHKPRAG